MKISGKTRTIFAVTTIGLISLVMFIGVTYAGGWSDDHVFWYTDLTSEENQPIQCLSGQLTVGIRCTGGDCDNIQMKCKAIPRDQYNNGMSALNWGPYLSEEAPNNFCSNGYYVKGVACKGKRCDNQSLLCFHPAGASHNNCSWTHWVSEENDPSKGKYNTVTCPNNKYVAGWTCKGKNCDNKQLLCCGL